MPIFNVHSYIPVRVKVTNVEADTHEAAIAAVETNDPLQRVIATMIQHHREGDEIEAIEVDEGALAVGYLVDVVGDEQHENSRSFDVDQQTGEATDISRAFGRNCGPSPFLLSALKSFDDADYLTKARANTSLANFQSHVYSDQNSLLNLLIRDLGELPFHGKAQALGTLSRYADMLDAMTHRIDEMADVTAFNASHDEFEIKVYAGAQEIGALKRTASGSWNDATYLDFNSQHLLTGLTDTIVYLQENYGSLKLVLAEASDNWLVYNDHGSPAASIVRDRDGSFELLSGDPGLDGTYHSLTTAVAALD